MIAKKYTRKKLNRKIQQLIELTQKMLRDKKVDNFLWKHTINENQYYHIKEILQYIADLKKHLYSWRKN